MAGEFSISAPIAATPAVFRANASVLTPAAMLKSAVFSADGAAHTSAGQRPGYAPSFHQAAERGVERGGN